LSLLLIILSGVALVAAAVSDIRSFRLPNALTLFVAVAAILNSVLAGSLSALGWPGSLVALAFGLILSGLGIVGAGDVKLLAACLLWFPGQAGLDFFLITTSLGALIALAALLWGAIRRRKIKQLPYGLAISAASLVGLLRVSLERF
jgi:prepilin peptidase CpaA